MRLFFALFLAVSCAACGSLNRMVANLNDAAGELMYGDSWIAGTLAPYPQDSGCSDRRCKELDLVERRGYELADAGRMSYVQLVDTFYKRRRELFPDAEDTQNVRELRSYQRALAEQRDLKRLSQSQWVYLIEKKTSEIKARGQ